MKAKDIKEEKREIIWNRLCKQLEKAKKERGPRNVTYEIIGEAVGLSKSRIEQIFSPKKKAMPTEETLQSLADFFECDIDYFLGEITSSTNIIEDIRKYIGLSEESIKILHNALKKDLEAVKNDNHTRSDQSQLRQTIDLLIQKQGFSEITAYLKSDDIKVIRMNSEAKGLYLEHSNEAVNPSSTTHEGEGTFARSVSVHCDDPKMEMKINGYTVSAELIRQVELNRLKEKLDRMIKSGETGLNADSVFPGADYIYLPGWTDEEIDELLKNQKPSQEVENYFQELKNSLDGKHIGYGLRQQLEQDCEPYIKDLIKTNLGSKNNDPSDKKQDPQ